MLVFLIMLVSWKRIDRIMIVSPETYVMVGYDPFGNGSFSALTSHEVTSAQTHNHQPTNPHASNPKGMPRHRWYKRQPQTVRRKKYSSNDNRLFDHKTFPPVCMCFISRKDDTCSHMYGYTIHALTWI